MQILLTPEAEKQYAKLPKIEKNKVKKKLHILLEHPESGKKLSGKLSILRSFRAWPYRIIYLINTARKSIYIVTIAHRQGVYKKS